MQSHHTYFCRVDNVEEQQQEQNSAENTQAKPTEEDRDERSVFVKNVEYSATEQELREHFKNAGEITAITIRKGPTGQPRG